jgi:hypothetical protein
MELLRCHIEEYGGQDGVVALLVFADIVLATDHLDLSEGLDALEGWKVVEVGMGELVAICAAFGIGHVALPTSPGLGQAGVGSVLEVADALARAWPRVIKRAGKSFMVSRPKPIGEGDITHSARRRAVRRRSQMR